MPPSRLVIVYTRLPVMPRTLVRDHVDALARCTYAATPSRRAADAPPRPATGVRPSGLPSGRGDVGAQCIDMHLETPGIGV